MRSRCLYCGESTKRGKRGEHIVPEAIGGSLTLNDVSERVVCANCNSGTLSLLDRELCSRSYLSIIASREIGAHVWQVWDVDHKSQNQLVEARPAWDHEQTLAAVTCYPQITFERSGAEVRGDAEEFRHFGANEFASVLFRAARHCFSRFRSGRKGAIHFERVRSGLLRQGHRLSPRIYAPHAIQHIARNIQEQSFVLRYIDESDRRFALNSLLNLDERLQPRNWTVTRGSYQPSFCFYFDIVTTARSLMKQGLNLIAAYCQETVVNSNTFGLAVQLIRDDNNPATPQLLRTSGFVPPSQLESIRAEGNAHAFRLVHLDGVWTIYFSYFSGKICASVQIPGPNSEKWRTLDVTAPLRSKEWTSRTYSMVLPLRSRLEWSDSNAIVPTFRLQDNSSMIVAEPSQPKRRAR